MKNSHHVPDIRQELIQYIGALLTSKDLKDYSESERKQIVCAALAEEALKLVTATGSIDLFAAKPILRATSRILDSEIQDYESLFEQETDWNKLDFLSVTKKKLAQAKQVLDILTEDNKEGIK